MDDIKFTISQNELFAKIRSELKLSEKEMNVLNSVWSKNVVKPEQNKKQSKNNLITITHETWNKIIQYVNKNIQQKNLKSEFVTEPQLEIKKANSYEEISNSWLKGLKDARNTDISGLNLTKNQLLNLRVDSTTKMSIEQRKLLQPYIEKMKDPGLNIRDLNKLGITGKNVKIAILDSPLSNNKEISNNIIYYENLTNIQAGSFHGNTVSSIAVGKECGVAPEADLIYYATNDCKDYSLAIQKIIAQNQELIKNGESPITVISISCGFDLCEDYETEYATLTKIIQEAKDNGIAVITCDQNIEPKKYPVGRNPAGDINSKDNYKIWRALKRDDWYHDIVDNNTKDKTLLIPGEHRTVAGEHQDYRYEGGDGGESWTIPYLAGVYALAKQVNPNLNYNDFYKIALDTADKIDDSEEHYYIGKLINPTKIIETIESNKKE